MFGAATVQTLQTATVVRLPLDPTMALSVSRTREAWRIAVGAARAAAAADPGDRGRRSASSCGRRCRATWSVWWILTPAPTLLVGTQRRDGQGVPATRRSAEFTLLPTWQGVAVEPNADTVALRATPQGFVVAGTSDPVADSRTSPNSWRVRAG